jgi:hypothetical protein
MILIDKRIDAVCRLGERISLLIDHYDNDQLTKDIILQAVRENPWFTEKNVLTALLNWIEALKSNQVEKWVHPYINNLNKGETSKNIGVVNAGNIPFVGLHDFLSILISGNNYIGKNATGDSVLLPWIASLMFEVEPAFKTKVRFVHKLENIEAVIATGNNNSSRYFEYYFGKYPNIIRKNRNGICILNGSDSHEQLNDLGKDIFTYFGLGCRNVSKLYVPEGYNFDKFFTAIYRYNEIMSHSKYMNNFDYNNSVLLLKQIPFLQNGFLIVRKEQRIPSPVSVLHYEEYGNLEVLEKKLGEKMEGIQCIVAGENILKNSILKKLRVDFGETQTPQLWDYADGVDTMKFLIEISGKK